MTQLRELQTVTLAEFEAMEKQEGLTYELIDGVVMMPPRPVAKHQWISGKLFAELWRILKGTSCIPIQEIDLILDGQNFVPDLMVICNENIGELKNCKKPPLIAMEIVSPSSTSTDYFTKRLKYELLGVQEYWIISPEEKCIMVIAFKNRQQERYCEGQVKSFVLPEIVMDLSAIFE